MGHRSRIYLMENKRESLQQRFDQKQKEYTQNKVLKKFLNDWLEGNDFPGEKILGGEVLKLIEEIDITNFKNEIKLRKWYTQLNP